MSRKEKPKIIVIKGGNLVDGTGAKPKRNSVVVIEGARIKAVGKESEVKMPSARARGVFILLALS